MQLPKYNKTAAKGELGFSIVKLFVEKEFNWILRKNHQEFDFGIDAYIDIVSELNQVTGKSIALQIKTGKSYFNEPTDLGWVYRGEVNHLNYYLNHDIPVVIILVDDEKNEIYWCLCDPGKTEKAGENWKIIVPRIQALTKSSKLEFEKYISPTIDYVSQLEHFWNMNKTLQEHERIILVVDKEEVINLDFSNLLLAFDRFETNENLISKLRNRVDVVVHGYNDDSRALFQIKEVMHWTREVFKVIDSWPFFLALDENSQFVNILCIAHSYNTKEGISEITPELVIYEEMNSKKFMEAMFYKLNSFCEKYGISEDIIFEISHRFIDCITNGEFSKSQGKQK